MSAPSWPGELDMSDERIVRHLPTMAVNPHFTKAQQVQRSVSRVGSILCIVASLVATYDLALLVGIV